MTQTSSNANADTTAWSHAPGAPGHPEDTDPNDAMPRKLAKELGDYAEGDYAVAEATKHQPTAEASHFAQTIRDASPDH